MRAVLHTQAQRYTNIPIHTHSDSQPSNNHFINPTEVEHSDVLAKDTILDIQLTHVLIKRFILSNLGCPTKLNMPGHFH